MKSIENILTSIEQNIAAIRARLAPKKAVGRYMTPEATLEVVRFHVHLVTGQIGLTATEIKNELEQRTGKSFSLKALGGALQAAGFSRLGWRTEKGVVYRYNAVLPPMPAV